MATTARVGVTRVVVGGGVVRWWWWWGGGGGGGWECWVWVWVLITFIMEIIFSMINYLQFVNGRVHMKVAVFCDFRVLIEIVEVSSM